MSVFIIYIVVVVVIIILIITKLNINIIYSCITETYPCYLCITNTILFPAGSEHVNCEK